MIWMIMGALFGFVLMFYRNYRKNKIAAVAKGLLMAGVGCLCGLIVSYIIGFYLPKDYNSLGEAELLDVRDYVENYRDFYTPVYAVCEKEFNIDSFLLGLAMTTKTTHVYSFVIETNNGIELQKIPTDPIHSATVVNYEKGRQKGFAEFQKYEFKKSWYFWFARQMWSCQAYPYNEYRMILHIHPENFLDNCN